MIDEENKTKTKTAHAAWDKQVGAYWHYYWRPWAQEGENQNCGNEDLMTEGRKARQFCNQNTKNKIHYLVLESLSCT